MVVTESATLYIYFSIYKENVILPSFKTEMY